MQPEETRGDLRRENNLQFPCDSSVSSSKIRSLTIYIHCKGDVDRKTSRAHYIRCYHHCTPHPSLRAPHRYAPRNVLAMLQTRVCNIARGTTAIPRRVICLGRRSEVSTRRALEPKSHY
jgi:hypothetical protein